MKPIGWPRTSLKSAAMSACVTALGDGQRVGLAFVPASRRAVAATAATSRPSTALAVASPIGALKRLSDYTFLPPNLCLKGLLASAGSIATELPAATRRSRRQ